MSDRIPAEPPSSPLPLAGGVGGGLRTSTDTDPPLAPPASGRGTDTPPPLTPTRAAARQATSAVAHVAPEPDEDDPLLAFEPYLHAAPRRNSITPPVQRRFVAALAATGLVSVAARRVGRSLEALYKLRHRPGAEGFAAAWDAALERGARRLEDMAFERALVGTRTPIVSGGQLLDWWDKPDNGLLRFLLRHRIPQTYGDSRSEAAVRRELLADLKPGHPVYDTIAAEAVAAYEAARPSPGEVRASLARKVEALRQQVLAERAAHEHAGGWDGATGD